MNYIKLLLLAALWGSSFSLMKVSVHDFDTAPLTFLRVFIGSLFLLPFVLYRKNVVTDPKIILIIAGVGLLSSALPFAFLIQASYSLNSGLISIINATTLVFTAFLAHIWLKEKFTIAQSIGLVVAIVGLYILLFHRMSFKPGGDGFAIVLCLAAALSYGISNCITRRSLKGIDPFFLGFTCLFVASLSLLPFAWHYWPENDLTATAWIPPLVLGCFTTGLAAVIHFNLIKNIGPSKASSVTLLIPFFGVIWGMIFLQEVLLWQSIVGGLIILIGAAVINQLIFANNK